MPIYEYECRDCGTREEVFEDFDAPRTRRCEHCGGKAKRLVSWSTFRLLGSGWPSTDAGKTAGGSYGQ